MLQSECPKDSRPIKKVGGIQVSQISPNLVRQLSGDEIHVSLFVIFFSHIVIADINNVFYMGSSSYIPHMHIKECDS